ncbi:hypothetical protein VTJ04DRAFT_8000 [Mycothermus thermophilus]|uniref:uncharacterized protein n=1 Tax=Humicola insolens TaxID=85995 RepID=UPI00374363E6
MLFPVVSVLRAQNRRSISDRSGGLFESTEAAAVMMLMMLMLSTENRSLAAKTDGRYDDVSSSASQTNVVQSPLIVPRRVVVARYLGCVSPTTPPINPSIRPYVHPPGPVLPLNALDSSCPSLSSTAYLRCAEPEIITATRYLGSSNPSGQPLSASRQHKTKSKRPTILNNATGKTTQKKQRRRHQRPSIPTLHPSILRSIQPSQARKQKRKRVSPSPLLQPTPILPTQ